MYWRKSTNEIEGKPEQKFMRLSERSLELVSVFKKASWKFLLIFLFNKAGKKS
jgi:hypothetical protein